MPRLPAPLERGLGLVAPAGTAGLLYSAIAWLAAPRVDEAAQVHDFSVLLLFELVLGGANVALLALRGRPGWQLLVLAMFALPLWFVRSALLDPTAMNVFIAALLLSHLRIGSPGADRDPRYRDLLPIVRLPWWLLAMVLGLAATSLFLPPAGLDQAWIRASGYDRHVTLHGVLDTPHVPMWIGVIFFGGLVAMQLFATWLDWRAGARPATANPPATLPPARRGRKRRKRRRR